MFSLFLRNFNSSRWISLSHKKYSSTLTSNNPLEEILNNLPPEAEALSPSDTINIFRHLSETSKNLNSLLPATSFKVIQHEKFEILRQAIKQSIPYLKTMDKFDVLKRTQILDVPIDDGVNNIIISSLLENVFNMSLNEILVFDALLAPQQKTVLTKELTQCFVNRFNIKVSSSPINFSYFTNTKRILQFILRNRNEITKNVFENMKNCLVKNDIDDIDILTANEAEITIILLSNFQEKCEYFDRLKEKALNVWQSSDVTMDMVQKTLTFLTKRNSSVIFNMYNDSRYLEKCVQVAIKSGDLQKCFAVQSQFNYMGFINSQLIDFLLENLNVQAEDENVVNNCISLFIACDIGNYRSPLFHEILATTLANMNFNKHFHTIKLDWAHLAVRLSQNGIYHKRLNDCILKRRFSYEFNVDSLAELETLELEKIIGVEIGSSLSNLKRVFGDNIRLLIRTSDGSLIPLLLKIDINSKSIVPFKKHEGITLNSLNCDVDQCLVAFVDCSTPDIQFQHPKLVTITLNATEWLDLLHHRTKEEIIAKIV
ncbi:uncharacterized protein LOC116339393 [Contarinia nasturtii]|uniref:uncharacterized protein LOC116339393 n=1 Tax=Contarinia nasturtii TaxID=265458 RepID=UPI0012D43E7D|nr:uncharacterized protein LOC116339393 [Contarinia nasturtii]